MGNDVKTVNERYNTMNKKINELYPYGFSIESKINNLKIAIEEMQDEIGSVNMELYLRMLDIIVELNRRVKNTEADLDISSVQFGG